MPKTSHGGLVCSKRSRDRNIYRVFELMGADCLETINLNPLKANNKAIFYAISISSVKFLPMTSLFLIDFFSIFQAR